MNIEWSIKRKTTDNGVKNEIKCIDLYSCKTDTIPRKVTYINDTANIQKKIPVGKGRKK